MEENKKDVLPLEGEPLTTPQISELVVNALAAALNKIETYVPTQYINDGPPDIDAEHLNHAEQAIMRVTNLANGAADAISALQSQVTQLNSDLQSDWIPLKPYLVNSWEDNGASLYRKIGNCYLIKLSVRYGNYETDLDICRNLPFSGTGVCTNCFYSSSEVGNAIQVSGNRLFITRTPTVKMDTIFANFIVGPDV